MKKILLLFLFLFSITAQAQKQRYFSLGTKHEGICFGNSENYNGIRLNLDDDEFVNHVNGLNLSLLSSTYYLNGLQFGITSSTKKTMNGFQG